jgi:hypothetical protein
VMLPSILALAQVGERCETCPIRDIVSIDGCTHVEVSLEAKTARHEQRVYVVRCVACRPCRIQCSRPRARHPWWKSSVVISERPFEIYKRRLEPLPNLLIHHYWISAREIARLKLTAMSTRPPVVILELAHDVSATTTLV